MSNPGGSDAVNEFLELEQELSTGTRSLKTYEEGNVANAAKVPAEEVPDDYPVRIRTRQALHLDVETPDGETVATYLEWPGEESEAQRASKASSEGRSPSDHASGQGPRADGERSDPRASNHVERLLDALGRSHDDFANVYGDRVALDGEDGWHSIDLDRTAALRRAREVGDDGSLDATRNLLAGAVAAAVIGLSLANPAPGLAAFPMFGSWFAIPLLVYYDGGRVEESTHWSPERLRWAAVAMVPMLNVAVGVAYLLERHVRLSGNTPSDAAATWRRGLVAGLVLSVAGFALAGGRTEVGAPLLVFSYLFLPFAVYFDARYVGDATDWDPNEELWTAVAVFFGLLGAGAYLVKRHVELD